MPESSPVARLLFRVRFFLFLAALGVLGLTRASAGIEASPDFPLDQAKASSESPADKLLSMYRKDVGIAADKVSSEKPAAPRLTIVSGGK